MSEPYDLAGTGPAHPAPITNAGRVPGNARLAQEQLEERQLGGAAGSLWPTAVMTDLVFRAEPREVALTPKAGAFSYRQDGLPPVFSVLNGLGNKGETRKQLIESLAFAGMIGSDGAKYDTTGNLPGYPDVAVTLGGTLSMTNTGMQRIRNGDRVFWDFPEEGDVPRQTQKRDGRILVETRPYRPSEMGITSKAIAQHMTTPRSAGSTNSRLVTDGTPIADASAAIKGFARANALMAFEAFLASGLVKYDAAALGTSGTAAQARQANAAQWASLHHVTRQNHIARVARALRIDGMRGSSVESEVRVPHVNNAAIGTYLTGMLVGSMPLVRPVDGSNNVPSGDNGAVWSAQHGAVELLLQGVIRAKEFTTERIFATATSSADPGQDFVVNIGAYTA